MKTKNLNKFFAACFVSVSTALFSQSAPQTNQANANVNSNLETLSQVFTYGSTKAHLSSYLSSANIEDKIRALKGINADEKVCLVSAFRYISNLPQKDELQIDENEKIARASLAIFAFADNKTLHDMAKHIHKDFKKGQKQLNIIVKNFIDQRSLNPSSYLEEPGIAAWYEVKNRAS
jgi:hypothetical protein